MGPGATGSGVASLIPAWHNQGEMGIGSAPVWEASLTGRLVDHMVHDRLMLRLMTSDFFPAQLVPKAGFKGSGGLGRPESGISSPIPAWQN